MPKLTLEITKDKLLDLLMQISWEEIEALLKQVRSEVKPAYKTGKNKRIKLSKYCGAWEDNRSAQEMVDEICEHREEFCIGAR